MARCVFNNFPCIRSLNPPFEIILVDFFQLDFVTSSLKRKYCSFSLHLFAKVDLTFMKSIIFEGATVYLWNNEWVYLTVSWKNPTALQAQGTLKVTLISSSHFFSSFWWQGVSFIFYMVCL